MTQQRYENAAFFEDIPESQEINANVSPMQELGVTGIKRTGGYVDEEWLPALRGRKAVQIYKEMSANDSMVGALLFAIDKLVREVEWKVVPSEQTSEGQAAAEFLESVMDDMSHSWDDFIGEVLSMLPFGWSWHEIVFKRRLGPWQKDGSKKSKYDDGLIGIRKMPIRAQETLLNWVFDENGGIKAMTQLAPPVYKTVSIPIERSLLFRTQVAKGNPEGVSLLRTAYRSWYFKKRLEEFEAIGVERDLAGMPVAKVPAEYLTAQKGSKQDQTVQAFRRMVRGVRRDENEGLVLPIAYDPDTKQPLYEFELMSSGGARQFDTTAIIQRYEQRILMCVLADFILVGHESTGSYSLHTDKTGIFRAALNAITKSIADTLNRHLVPRLFEINGWKMDELPKFEPTNIDPPALDQLAAFITATAGAGMQWFPDPELEKFLRDIARLPEMSDETVDFKRDMLMQEQAMQYAESQMGLLGMKQKAEMTAQGYSPEQAQLASEQATPEMQEALAYGEQQAELQRREHVVGQEDSTMMQEEQERQMMMEQMKLGPEPDSEKSQGDEARAQAQFKREKEMKALDDKYADRQFRRDRDRTAGSDKSADRATRREREVTSLKDKMEEKKHQRQLRTIKEQAKAQSRAQNQPKKDKK